MCADNTPDWLWDNWCTGIRRGPNPRIAEAHLIQPPLDITVKPNLEAVAAALGERSCPRVGATA